VEWVGAVAVAGARQGLVGDAASDLPTSSGVHERNWPFSAVITHKRRTARGRSGPGICSSAVRGTLWAKEAIRLLGSSLDGSAASLREAADKQEEEQATSQLTAAQRQINDRQAVMMEQLEAARLRAMAAQAKAAERALQASAAYLATFPSVGFRNSSGSKRAGEPLSGPHSKQTVPRKRGCPSNKSSGQCQAEEGSGSSWASQGVAGALIQQLSDKMRAKEAAAKAAGGGGSPAKR
jgi:hypothetical protein